MKSISLEYIRHAKRVPPPITRGRLRYHELTIVLSGSMKYIVKDAEYTLGPKDAIFIPEGTLRERLPGGTETDYISLNFTSDSPDLPTYIGGACHSEIVMLISAIDKIQAKHRGANEEIRSIAEIIISLLESYERTGKMTETTRKILDHIHCSFRERITLEDIGRLTFFSPVYCETLFRREVGRPIVDYVIDLRITEAEKLIHENALSLAEIARAVGFEDYNYFSRTFKRRTGYSPTAYRRQTRG